MTASRVDANQPAIVAALRAAGAVVIPINKQRDAGFDILVFYDGDCFVTEIKAGKHHDLTDNEKATRALLWGVNYYYHVITSVEEALQMIGRAA